MQRIGFNLSNVFYDTSAPGLYEVVVGAKKIYILIYIIYTGI